MKLLTFSPRGLDIPRPGVLICGSECDLVLDIYRGYEALYEATPPSWFWDLKLLIEGGSPALDLLRRFVSEAERDLRSSSPSLSRHVYRIKDIEFYPPIGSPEKILCLAANYRAHAQETRIKPPEEPYVFYKPASALVGHERPIYIPRSSQKVDYEVELAVVIGRRGKYIERSRAMDYVLGYSVFNDISYRDRQMPQGWPDKIDPFGQRWLHGKGMDTGAPMGPWIATRDEIEDPHSLRISLRVNGEVRQDSNTGEMIFKIDSIIEFISNGITLKPGDIIATGTPPGVALASGRYLKHGDIVEAYIEKIGLLRNQVLRES